MGTVLAIAMNDIRLLLRDKGATFFTIVFPLALAVFFGAIFGGRGTSKLRVVLVDLDHTPGAAAFAGDLAGDDSLEVSTTAGEGDKAHAITRDEGLEWVRKGWTDVCVVIPQGFDSGSIGVFSGGGMKVEGFVAPGRSAEAGLVVGKLNQMAFRQLTRSFGDSSRVTGMLDDARQRVTTSTMDPAAKAQLESMFGSIDAVSKRFGGITPGTPAPAEKKDGAKDGAKSDAKDGAKSDDQGGGWSPVNVTMTELKDESNHPRTTWEISFPQGVVWALMGCVTAFGASVNAERTRGTLLRLTVAPISPRGLLLGKALGCFLTCVGVQALLIGLATGVFGGVMGKFHVDQPLMLALAVVLSAFGFTGLMMVLAGLTRTEGGTSGMGRGLIIMLAMIGGGTVPLFFLPPWVQTIGNVSPFKWVTMAIEGSIWRGFTWGDFALPAAVLVGCGVVGFFVGNSALKVGSRA